MTEYCCCGTIATYLGNGNRLSEDELRDVVSCCLLGLRYLDGTEGVPGVIHGEDG